MAIALGAGIGLGARKLADRDHNRRATPAATTTTTTTTPGPRPLRRGRYNSQHVSPVRYFIVGAGWRLDIDRAAILEVSRQTAPFGSIGFDLPLQVLEDGFLPADQATSATAKVRPLPADVGAFFRSRPELETSASRPAAVDGVAGETFVVRLKPLPNDNLHLCGPTRCMFYARNGRQLYALFENDATEFTVLRLKKQTLVIAVAAPDAKIEDFRPLARRVLATVHLRQR